MKSTTYTFILEVRDAPGVLVRIAQIFARRGANIRSLNVYSHEDGLWSTITIVVLNVPRAEQIARHIEKLIDVQSATLHAHATRTPNLSNPQRTLVS